MRAGVDLGGTEVMTGASIGIALGYPAATVEELMRIPSSARSSVATRLTLSQAAAGHITIP